MANNLAKALQGYSIGSSGSLTKSKVQGPGLGYGGSSDTLSSIMGSGQVLGSKTSANQNSAGGSVGDFNSILTDVKKQGILQNSKKSQPKINYDAIYAPALKSLNDYANQLQSNLPQTYADLEAQRNASANSLQTQQQTQQAGLNQQRQAAGTQTESALGEARRSYAELQKGLQANYGGTTGTGAFTAELAGRQTLQNIGNIRSGYQTTLAQITDAENSLNNDVKDKMFQLDQQLTQAKNEARQNLMDRIAQINAEKNTLEVDKANKKMDAMREYQAMQVNIEAQNKQFIQGLYQEYQQKLGTFSQAKDVATQNYIDALNQAQGQNVDLNSYLPQDQGGYSADQGGLFNINTQQQNDPLGLGLQPIAGDALNLLNQNSNNYGNENTGVNPVGYSSLGL